MATPFSPLPERAQRNLWPASSAGAWVAEPLEAFKDWLVRRQAMAGFERVRDTTQDTYQGIFQAWLGFVSASQQSVLEADVGLARCFFSEHALEPVSRRRYLQLLEKVYDHLLDQGLIRHNPFRLLAGEVEQGVGPLSLGPEALTQTECDALVAHLTAQAGWRMARDKGLLAVLLGAGLRVNEVQALQLKDFLPDWRLSIVPNGVHCAHHTLVLPEGPWRRWLEQWQIEREALQIPGPWVFPATRKGSAMSASGVFRRVAGWLDAAGVVTEGGQKGPNLLRNTFARTALASGRYSPEQVRSFMGHHDLRATLRHLPPEP